MTKLVQNQGKRKFIVAEGTLMPLGTLEMDDKAAEKLCGSYPDELKVIKVLNQPSLGEPKEDDDLTLKTRVDLMEMLDEKGIEYKPNAKKDELIALLIGE